MRARAQRMGGPLFGIVPSGISRPKPTSNFSPPRSSSGSHSHSGEGLGARSAGSRTRTGSGIGGRFRA